MLVIFTTKVDLSIIINSRHIQNKILLIILVIFKILSRFACNYTFKDLYVIKHSRHIQNTFKTSYFQIILVIFKTSIFVFNYIFETQLVHIQNKIFFNNFS